jgi:hypothetical protein
MTEMPQVQSTAREMHGWFQSVLDLADAALFGIVPAGPHRSAVVLAVLSRNARILSESEMDQEGKLYKPLSLFLAAACRKLKVSLVVGHWQAAVENVLRLRKQTTGLQMSTAVALDLGGPAAIFFQQLREAITSAGLSGTPSFLDKEDREIALGLAINWALRFLLAYALECTPPGRASGQQDLAWIRSLLVSAQVISPRT